MCCARWCVLWCARPGRRKARARARASRPACASWPTTPASRCWRRSARCTTSSTASWCSWSTTPCWCPISRDSPAVSTLPAFDLRGKSLIACASARRAEGDGVRRGAAARIACIAFVATVTGMAWAAREARAQLPDIDFEKSDEPVALQADTVEFERGRNLYVASGAVVIRQGERTLSADWIAFNNTTRRGVASGRVTLVDGPDVLHTSFAEFDVANLQGILFEARLDSGSSQFKM